MVFTHTPSVIGWIYLLGRAGAFSLPTGISREDEMLGGILLLALGRWRFWVFHGCACILEWRLRGLFALQNPLHNVSTHSELVKSDSIVPAS